MDSVSIEFFSSDTNMSEKCTNLEQIVILIPIYRIVVKKPLIFTISSKNVTS